MLQLRSPRPLAALVAGAALALGVLAGGCGDDDQTTTAPIGVTGATGAAGEDGRAGEGGAER